MRVVRDPGELEEALAAAQREAEAAFGDGTVFCERFVERPRHVEIQLLGDGRGRVIALGERECSVQRRHQKVLEESPSPALDPELRERMSDAAVSFATGDRLSERRNSRVHARRPRLLLPRAERADPGRAPGHGARHRRRPRRRHSSSSPRAELPSEPELQGHAVEVRLYAEDPRTFLPQAGRIERLRLPEGIRVDAGVEEGDEVGIAYDPMIAKLIAHGRRGRGLGAGSRPRSPRPRSPASPRTCRSCAGSSRILPSEPAARRRGSWTRTRRSRRRPSAFLPVPGRERGGSTCPLPLPQHRRTSTSPAATTAPLRSRARSPRRCREP